MHVLITGAAGMIGRKLAERLARDGAINGVAVDRMTLADIVPSAKPAGFAGPVDVVAADLASAAVLPRPQLNGRIHVDDELNGMIAA